MLINKEDELDEFIPYKLNSQEKLIQYWSNTLKDLDTFWGIWKDEYLNSLKKRNREHSSLRDLIRRAPHEGEILLVNEPEALRCMWKLVKMKEIKRGKDGEVRSVSIELPQGKILNKPVNMLYSLEIKGEENLDSQPTVFDKSIQNVDEQESIVRRTRNAINRHNQTKIPNYP
ncbi:unnamed protein product [Wuchereria bancrofti]|uniref:DUF5641 domain-containing protein n=1 Tax=Wuchereria bancrofti TaxID=6293 RepID=A0A3P7DTF4_WUCBA|nr:unnamed protein product [Wuchereria bancrofti]